MVVMERLLQSSYLRVILAAGNHLIACDPLATFPYTAIAKYSDFYQAVLVAQLLKRHSGLVPVELADKDLCIESIKIGKNIDGCVKNPNSCPEGTLI